MENEELIEHPHRWCRVVHRSRLYVLPAVLLLMLASAVVAGDVLVLAYLAAGVAAGAAYVWWAWRSAQRGGETKDDSEGSGPRDFHAVLYAKKGWARLAVATDIFFMILCVAAGALSAAASLWAGHEGKLSLVAFVVLVCSLALATALNWWENWVHVRAVGWHVVGPDGAVVSTH